MDSYTDRRRVDASQLGLLGDREHGNGQGHGGLVILGLGWGGIVLQYCNTI